MAFENEWMRAGHPTEALVEFVRAVGTHVREPGAAAAAIFINGAEDGMFFQIVEPGGNGLDSMVTVCT